MRQLVAYYSLIGWSVKMSLGGRHVVKDVQARWSIGAPDSIDGRAQVTEAVREYLGVERWDASKIEVDLSGMVPPGFQPENRAALYFPMSSYRAKCVVTIEPAAGVPAVLEKCHEIEARLGDELSRDDKGFVDGHDLDERLFRIYCYGKRKAGLLLAVRETVGELEWASVSLK